MHSPFKYLRFISVALCAMGVGVAAAQTTPASEAKAVAVTAKESLRKGPASAADLQKLMEQMNSQREKLIADHEALGKQLKDATDDARKLILAKMHEQKKAFEAEQSALHKQIRDEQRRQRQSSAPGKR
jgi:Skp family chaperone for outer membrane proteins